MASMWGVLLRLKKIGRAGGTRYEGMIIQVAVVGCRVGKRSAPTARFRGRVDGKYATAVTSFRSPLRRVYMCVFLTRTCKGGSPPPPLQSRLPAENRPCGEAAPFSPPATGRARQYVPVLSCPRTAYSAHPWASPLRGQRFALFKNAPGIFVLPVRPGLRRNGAADFFKPEPNPPL